MQLILKYEPGIIYMLEKYNLIFSSFGNIDKKNYIQVVSFVNSCFVTCTDAGKPSTKNQSS